MIAGAGLNDRATVEFVVEHAPAAIERLAELGVPFNADGDSERWHLTREGGHRHRRIVHVDDATGWAVQQALEQGRRGHPNITLVPDMVAIDLVTSRHGERYSGDGHVWGVYALNRATGKVETFTARATILATGGAGRVYLFSTAPRGATGDGIAMAWRAGCRISNMEIHAVPPDLPLQSRGQELPDHRGGARRGRAAEEPRRPATASCPISTSAPSSRRATSSPARSTTRSSGSASTTSISTSATCAPDFVREHFPNIHEKLLELGIDMTKEPIPVVPAQHYTCGGVVDRPRRAHRPARPLRGRARSASRGCTAPTGSPPTRCSNASCSARRRRRHIAANWDDLRAAAADPRLGRKPGHRFRRGSGDQAELDRDPPLHVELCRHRPHHQAARARPAPDQAAAPTRSRIITAISGSRRT